MNTFRDLVNLVLFLALGGVLMYISIKLIYLESQAIRFAGSDNCSVTTATLTKELIAGKQVRFLVIACDPISSELTQTKK